MPVRNALPYLDQAIASIIAQTHGDFEFVIGDDCSTDGTRERLREWARRDARIRLMESDVPLGPVGSSNWVAMAATCPLVARMDADDVSRSNRLERQIAVLQACPDAVLVGSLGEAIDRNGRLTRPIDRSRLLDGGRIPVHHSSILYRHEAFVRAGAYREGCDFFEDTDLYFRMGAEGALLVVPESLNRVRFSEAGGRLSGDQAKVEDAIDRSFALKRRSRLIGYKQARMELEGNPARPHRLAPQTFWAIGSLRLWSGHCPAVLWRTLRRARLRFDRATAATLVWALWGAVNAASLRAALRFRIRQRDRAAAALIGDGQVYQWWCNDGAPAPAPRRRQAEGAEHR
jgi:glycosyltransferase involved in cell wall biosynthesis